MQHNRTRRSFRGAVGRVLNTLTVSLPVAARREIARAYAQTLHEGAETEQGRDAGRGDRGDGLVVVACVPVTRA